MKTVLNVDIVDDIAGYSIQGDLVISGESATEVNQDISDMFLEYLRSGAESGDFLSIIQGSNFVEAR